MSRADDLRELVPTILRKLYLKEVAGLGPGPRWCGGAVVGTCTEEAGQEPEYYNLKLKPDPLLMLALSL
jgi:hypothetical protein